MASPMPGTNGILGWIARFAAHRGLEAAWPIWSFVSEEIIAAICLGQCACNTTSKHIPRLRELVYTWILLKKQNTNGFDTHRVIA